MCCYNGAYCMGYTEQECLLYQYSDLRLKEDIVFLHKKNGHNVYQFKYREELGLPSNKRYIGVMAQEVMQTHPEAVTRLPSGYLAVRYDLIGVPFREVEAW